MTVTVQTITASVTGRLDSDCHLLENFRSQSDFTLGVHEQTLRSWERKGLIHLARLPQSGYRRVPVTEVQRLQTAMHTPTSTNVRLEPPQREIAAIEKATALAAQVRAELADLDATVTFDDFMQERRGRTWLP